jgi:hypothetical protein
MQNALPTEVKPVLLEKRVRRWLSILRYGLAIRDLNHKHVGISFVY